MCTPSLIHWRKPCMTKCDTAFKCLIYQESFTYPATAINCHKLRRITVIQAIELLNFLFASYQFHLKNAFYRATKIVKISFTDK